LLPNTHFLFNEAWVKTMIPATIISRFKRSRMYPFNPEALDYSVSNDVGKKSTTKINNSRGKKSHKRNQYNSQLIKKKVSTEV